MTTHPGILRYGPEHHRLIRERIAEARALHAYERQRLALARQPGNHASLSEAMRNHPPAWGTRH